MAKLDARDRAEVVVFADANGAYTRAQAIRLMLAATDLNIPWFEEPVSSDDLKGLGIVRDHVLPDVAASEYGYGYDLPYFTHMVPLVDCLQVDVTRCVGITAFLRAAASRLRPRTEDLQSLRTTSAPRGRGRRTEPSPASARATPRAPGRLMARARRTSTA